MITYMTRRSHHMTMKDLAPRDLITQFDHALEALKALCDLPSEIGDRHPVCLMWKGYEHCLAVYCHYAIWCRVNNWGHRMDISDPFAIDPQVRLVQVEREARPKYQPYEIPPWFHDLDVLRSHRSQLLRRNPRHYGEIWKDAPDNWPVLWPVIDPDYDEGYYLTISQLDKKKIELGKLILPNLDSREVFIP